MGRALGFFLFISFLFPASSSAEKIYGFSFPSWWHNAYDSSEAQESLQNLAQTGAGWVVIIPTWQMSSAKDSVIRRTDSTVSDASLESTIRRAKSLGLKVMLKPHIDLTTGEIRAKINSDQPQEWFKNYNQIIFHYAEMAKKLNVEYFCVGTELAGMSGYSTAWTWLIAEVRKIYGGPLTYAANWYDYAKVGFWSKLDSISIDAYFPLFGGPTKDGMVKNWKGFYMPQIEKVARQHGKPILFTEIGISSQKGAHKQPYAYHDFGALDLEVQKNYYEALIESFRGKTWFLGFLQWAWELNPKAGGMTDKSMTVQGKPALDVLTKFFKNPLGPAAPQTALLQDFLAQTQLPKTMAPDTAR